VTHNPQVWIVVVGLALGNVSALASEVTPNALPTGGQITAGTGAITQSGNVMVVQQDSAKLVANWGGFNIGSAATVQFRQPNASSVALNRVTGGDPSQILGSLTANGRVYLLNPAGIVFGKTANVNVGGLVASTLALSDADFLAGRNTFTKSGTAGSIVNEGKIAAAPGGLVAFIAPVIRNEGTLSAPNGDVALAAADKVDVDFAGDGRLRIRIDLSAIDAEVANHGLIKADGGAVVMSAKSADNITRAVVNNTGIVEANTVAEKNGRIVLESSGSGIVANSGRLSAQGLAAGETGGAIVVTGERVGLMGSALVDASGQAGGGTVAIGGGFQGKDATIANAKKAIVDTAAVIRANAGTTGNGGNVVVWADDTTRYHGSIETKGGALSGNGGQVEVSGKGWLDFQGRVNTTATAGQGGSLLLDPTNIVVATADPGGGAVSRTLASELDAATDYPAETSWITPTDLVGLLNTANVTFQAYNDITFNNAVDASSNAGNFGLTLYAGRSILINDNITLRGSFTAYANSASWAGMNRGVGAGDFTMAPGTSIVSSAPSSGITISVGTQNPLGTATIEGLRSTGISGAVSANINVYADSIDLSGAVDSIISTRYVTLRPTTTTRPILVGAAGDGSQTAITATELATVKATGASGRINFGDTGQTGGITLSGPLSFNNEVWLYNTGTGGAITLDSTAAVDTNGNILGFNAGTGDTGAFTQANGATISGGAGGLYIYADSIALNGAAGSISGTGSRTIFQNSASRPMRIGGADAAESGICALSANELGTLASGYSALTFGSPWTGGTGGATLSGPLSFTASVSIYNNGVGGSITLDPTANLLSSRSVYLYAGSGDVGTFTQASGATIDAGGWAITIIADSIALNGATNSIGSSGGGIYLQPKTASRPIIIGADDAAGLFALNAAEILTLTNGFSEIDVGVGTGTGGLTISNALSFNDTLYLNQAAGGAFTVNGTPTVSGSLNFGGAAPVALNASIAAISSVSFGGAVTVGADNLTVAAGTGTATFGGTVNHGANAFTVTADNVALSGNWTGTGARILQPTTVAQTIGLAGATGTFALSTAELGYISNDSPSSVTIGRSGGTGAITGGALSFNDPLVLRGGAITQTLAWTLSNTASFAAGASNITLGTSGNDFTGALTIVSGNDVTLDGANSLLFGGISTVSGTLGLTATSFTQDSAATITGGAGAITITADTIALNGVANSISGTGSIVLQQATAARPMVIGVAGGAGDFALDANEVATLKNGFSQIQFGNSGGNLGTGGITLSGPLAFNDRVSFYNTGVGGSITLAADAAVDSQGNNIALYAGSGNAGIFTQTNGATIAAGAGTITMRADSMALNGAANSISGSNDIYIAPSTSTRPMIVGAAGAASDLALAVAEVATLKDGFASIWLGGNAVTGGVTLSGALPFNDSLYLQQAAGGSFTVAATPTVSGSLNFSGAAPVALDVSVAATSGVSFAGAVTVGADNLTVDAGTGTATFSSTVAHGANNFTVMANDVALSGNWTGTGARILQPTTVSQTIGLAGGTGTFALSTAELGYLSNDSPASVTIGRSGGTGAITGAAFSFNDPFALRGGAITQTGAWTVSNTASLAAGAGNNITLSQAANDFTGAVTIASANIVSLRDTNALDLAASTVSGNLTVQTGGALTQAGDLAVTGTTSITAGANDITLSRAANNFGGAVSIVSGKDVSLRDTNALVLGTSTMSGNLTVRTGGALTQTGALAITGTTSLTAGILNDITLAQSGNDFGGAVTIVSGKNVSLTDANTLLFDGASTVSSDLNLTAAGFTQAASATISSSIGDITITADSIALNGAADSLSGIGNIGLLPRTDSRPMVIGAAGTAGDFALDAIELAALANGFFSVILGSTSGTGGVTLSGPLSFNDIVEIHNGGVGGSIALDSTAAVNTNNGSIDFHAGTGDGGAFIQANGATITTGSGIYAHIVADSITLNGAANSISGSGVLSLRPSTSARPIVIGAANAPGVFALDANEIATLKQGYLYIKPGDSSATGGITFSGPVTFNDTLYLHQAAGGYIDVNAPLTVNSNVYFLAESGTPAVPVTVNSLVTASGTLAFGNASLLFGTAPVIAQLNASVSGANGVYVLAGGSVSVGADNVVIDAGAGSASIYAAVAHGVHNITVTADDVALSGNWTGTGARLLQPTTVAQTIGLAGATGTFALSTAELGYISNDSPSSVTIGRSGGTGAIIGAAFSFNDPLVLRGGAITQTGAWTLGSTASFAAGAGNNITLDQASNDFTGAVAIASANNVSVTDVNSLTLGTSIISGNLTAVAHGGDLTVDGNLAKTSGADATATLKASDNIIFNSGGGLSASSNMLNTVLWADADGNGAGGIWLKGNTIDTNGAYLWMGGGATDTAWNGLTVGGDGTTPGYAVGNATNFNGIEINGATTITTNGGNIAMYGKGAAGGSSANSNADGIWFNGNGISVNSGAGTIVLDGVAQGTGQTSAIGVEFYNGTQAITSSATAGNDAITIRGTGSSVASVPWTQGVFFHANEGLYATGGGNIIITGIGGGGTNKQGLYFENAATSVASAGSGNLTLIANTMNLSGSFSGTGAFTVKPYSAGTTIGIAGGAGTLALSSADFTTHFVGGFSGITIGSATAGDINVGSSALAYTSPLTLKTAGSIVLNSGASLTGNNNALVLNADADTNGGGITINSGSTINTGGGAIVMGGGDCTTTASTAAAIATGAAGDIGINIHGTVGSPITIGSGGGAIWLWGRGPASGGSGFGAEYATIDSGTAGSVSIRGDGWYVNTPNGNGNGLLLSNSTVRGGSGGMSLIGNANTNNPGNAQWSDAIRFSNLSSAYTTGGGVLAASAQVEQHNGWNNYMLFDSSSLLGGAQQNGDIQLVYGGTASTYSVYLPNITLPAGNLSIDSHRGIAAGNSQAVAGTTTIDGGGVGWDVDLASSGTFNTGTLTVSNVRNLSVLDVDTLSLGTNTTAGTITIATVTGNLTLTGAVTTTDASANAIKLNAGRSAAAGTATGGNIVASGGTISVGGGGFATLYTGSVSGSNGLAALVGSGTGHFRYNSDETTTNYSTALTSGLNAIYREQPTLTVTPESHAITYGDATPAFSATIGTAYANGDASAGTTTGTATWTIGGASSTAGHLVAGAHEVSYHTGLSTSLGYGFADNGTSLNELTIGQKSLAVTGLTTATRAYNATNIAVLGGTAAITALLTDDVTIGGTATGTFANKNFGTGKAVTVVGNTISGTDATNYTLVQQTGLAADISKANLVVTGLTTANRTYDATNIAVLGGTAAITALLTDDVTIGGAATGTFASKNFGTGKGVTVVGNTISGTDATNYTLVQQTGLTADISKANLVVTGLTTANRTYDATNIAVLGGTASITALLTDDVTIGGTATGTFANKNFGTGKAVTVVGNTISGTDATNYTLIQQTGLAADISKANLVVTGLTTANRAYNATNIAVMGGAAAITALLTDDVTIGGTATGTFANKNFGTGKAVTVVGNTISGTDATNYTLVQQTGLTADIAALAIGLTGTKTYDGSAIFASGLLSITNRIGSDDLSFSGGTATRASKDVLGSSAIAGNTLTLGGTDALNYTTTGLTGALAITAAPLTVTYTGVNRVYDTTTGATVTTSDNRLGSDVLTINRSAAFTTKDVADGKTVNVTGVSLGGTDAGNYTVAATGATTANITPATLTVGYTGVNRIYDTTTGATVTTSDDRLGSDVLTINRSAAFTTKDVADGKTVNVTGVSLTGTDAGNYTVAATGATTANITPATLAVTYTGVNRIYDTTTGATVTTSDDRLGSDVLTINRSASFTTKDVAYGKTVNVTGVSLGGTDAGNYTVAATTGTTTADITPAALLVSGLTVNDKIYDGNTSAVIGGSAAVTPFGGDVVTLGGSSTAVFVDKNVGTGKAVAISGLTLSGTDAGNYTIASTGSAFADITAKSLTATFTAADKVYDGTTAATSTGSTITGFVGTETVGATNTAATFDTRNVGNIKTVTVSGIALTNGANGGLASNYTIAANAATTANITPATLTYVANPAQAFSAVSLPVLSGTVTGFVGGDSLGNSTTGTTRWTSTVTPGSFTGDYAINGSGLAAGNYTFVQAAGNATALFLQPVNPVVTDTPRVEPFIRLDGRNQGEIYPFEGGSLGIERSALFVPLVAPVIKVIDQRSEEDETDEENPAVTTSTEPAAAEGHTPRTALVATGAPVAVLMGAGSGMAHID
jgi:filamentous hemagglutinin family protein